MKPTSLEWRGSAILAGERAPAGEVRESGADERPSGGGEAKDHKMVMIKQARSAWDRLPPNVWAASCGLQGGPAASPACYAAGYKPGT
jgi:hypothetical protein